MATEDVPFVAIENVPLLGRVSVVNGRSPVGSGRACGGGRRERNDWSPAPHPRQVGKTPPSRHRPLVLVCWVHEVLVLPHPVTVAADVDDVAVVQQTVDEGRCHDFVGQHTAAFLEALVGGEHR